MIAKAMKVRPPKLSAAPGPTSLDLPAEGTTKKVTRGTIMGALEGLGIKPGATPGEVISGTAKNVAQGTSDLVSETYKANSGFPPELRGIATAIDLIPHFIEKTATGLETGGREAIAAAKRGDYEEAAEKGASTLTSAALLRTGKPAAEAETGLSKVGTLRARVQPFARKVTGVEPAVREAVTKAAEKQGTALEEHAAQSENVAQRGGLAKTVDTKSQELGKHLEKVEASVGKEANKKFDAVRAKIGNPETEPTGLIESVRNAETNILQGIPENIKEFRTILSMEAPENLTTEAAIREHYDPTFEPEGGEPLTWDKLQSLKSRIDARLRKGRGMNGDLKRALFQTRDSIVGEMGKMAEANGAKAEWAEARNFWRQYKEDFHEPTGPSGSGSPIAQALDAVDPKNIRQPFLRTQSAIGNRGTEILRKYPQHGGREAAALADEVVGHHQVLQDTPNKPKGFSPEKPPAAPVVDATKVARDAIALRARNWGSFNARDIGILSASAIGGVLEHILSGRGGYELPIASVTYEGGKYAASRLLNKPGVVEWLSRTPQAEIDALNKIPGADRVRIAAGITDAAVKSGRPVRLSPAARSFLGPANVARILAISAAGNQVKTPGEARDRLRTVAPSP